MGQWGSPLESMEINTEFWVDKKILITGHTGFKGGWLSIWLNMLGAKVAGLSLQPSDPCLFKCARVAEGIESHIGDIRDYKLVKNLIGKIEPEIIFHLAAQPLVRYSYINPIETFSTNVMGTVHLMNGVRENSGTRVFINITSDKCYQNNEWEWSYRENEPMGGYDPYSASKGCSELVTTAMRESYFENGECFLASVRAGNVFGGGDWATDRLIPDIMIAFMQEKKVMIRNPFAIRPWQHVLDPLCGYMILAQRLWEDGREFAEGWNFGPGQDSELPVSEMADHLACIWGENAEWQAVDTIESVMKEAHSLKLDCSKARERLAWKPHWKLRYGLEKTVEWYQAYSRSEDMRKVTEEQILAYMDD